MNSQLWRDVRLPHGQVYVENNAVKMRTPRDVAWSPPSLPDAYSVAARLSMGMAWDASWQWFQAEAVHGGTLLTGAIPIGFVVRGKHKGDPKFPAVSRCDRVVLTRDETRAAKARIEAETGLCYACSGSGWVPRGFSELWRHYDGCKRCSQSGLGDALRALHGFVSPTAATL